MKNLGDKIFSNHYTRKEKLFVTSNARNDNGVSVGNFVTNKMYVGVKIIESAHETFVMSRHTTIMNPS